VQKFIWKYWREVRVPGSAGSVPVAGVKAKTMTNKCPFLSVLGGRSNFFSSSWRMVLWGLIQFTNQFY
jgi:hypothetical protein